MSERDWCVAADGGARLSVQVTPNARKSEITGVQEGMLRIKLQAQPIEGKANEALVRYLAERLQVPRKAVNLTHGAASRQKTLAIDGLAPEAIKALLYPDQ